MVSELFLIPHQQAQTIIMVKSIILFRSGYMTRVQNRILRHINMVIRILKLKYLTGQTPYILKRIRNLQKHWLKDMTVTHESNTLKREHLAIWVNGIRQIWKAAKCRQSKYRRICLIILHRYLKIQCAVFCQMQ